jgi:DNA uptake protein ComE-like DNA-binding protein
MLKIRVNLANSRELLEIPGIEDPQAQQIVQFRTQHGPIRDAAELGRIVGPDRMTPALLARVDFDPAEDTAPESPGA